MVMERRNPDEILAMVKAEEETNRGKLKIFFGAMAGVGKTYTMLEAAKHRKKEGIDVAIGFVETHKRAETEALLEGLELLPRKFIEYKNIKLPEFDIDSVLKRNPKLIIVDELAHTNAPGSRHIKRWQDIEELLNKGIDVYTTLNVQHCESLNDVVTQITGIIVRETVPDTFIERADEIELVDLPTEELLKRLKEGKVYLAEQAVRAAENFFKPGNLIALRQLALRYTANRVDSKLQSYKQTHSITKIWNIEDRFLVCISPSPEAVHLIRAGKRIASDLGVGWIVSYVETPARIDREGKSRVSEMMRLAEKLGAETVTLSGQDIAETLISYAHSKNITKIIVGKPGKPRFKEIIFGSVIDKIARKSGKIDLYLLSDKPEEEHEKIRPMVLPPISREGIVWAFGVVIFCTLVNKILHPHLDVVNLIMIYLLGVTWLAFRYGRRVSIIASFLGILSFDFFFVPPYNSFAVADFQYIITFAVMMAIGFIIAHLTGQLQRQNAAMRFREDRTQALYAISRDLSKSSYPAELFSISLKHVEGFFQCKAVIFMPDEDKKLIPGFGKIKEVDVNSNDYAVVEWVYENKKSAGKSTETLPGANGIYLPFTGSEKTVGVLGVFPKDDQQFKDPDQFHILEMFVSQTALAVEGAQLAASAIDARSKIENERLKNMLLTTFSYELKLPLKSLSETASELLSPENIDNKTKRVELAEKMRREADLLNTLVDELSKIIEAESKLA